VLEHHVEAEQAVLDAERVAARPEALCAVLNDRLVNGPHDLLNVLNLPLARQVLKIKTTRRRRRHAGYQVEGNQAGDIGSLQRGWASANTDNLSRLLWIRMIVSAVQSYFVKFVNDLVEADDVSQVTRAVVVLKVRVAEPLIDHHELVELQLLLTGALSGWVCAVLKGELIGDVEGSVKAPLKLGGRTNGRHQRGSCLVTAWLIPRGSSRWQPIRK